MIKLFYYYYSYLVRVIYAYLKRPKVSQHRSLAQINGWRLMTPSYILNEKVKLTKLIV